MQPIQKQNVLIGFYVSILTLLLISVIATPLLIRKGIFLTKDVILKEEFVETGLIIILFCISFFILRSFMHTLKAYRKRINRAGEEKSRLVSRLADAFDYIGTVNVEIHEIESAFCGLECYPQSKREFNDHIDRLATRAMTIAAVPWLVVRIIDRHNARTVHEHGVGRPGVDLPQTTLGNRAALDGHRVDGLQTLCSRQQNLDLLTVFILPQTATPRERAVLLRAILNQIEMLFLLYRAGCLKPANREQP